MNTKNRNELRDDMDEVCFPARVYPEGWTREQEVEWRSKHSEKIAAMKNRSHENGTFDARFDDMTQRAFWDDAEGQQSLEDDLVHLRTGHPVIRNGRLAPSWRVAVGQKPEKMSDVAEVRDSLGFLVQKVHCTQEEWMRPGRAYEVEPNEFICNIHEFWFPEPKFI